MNKISVVLIASLLVLFFCACNDGDTTSTKGQTFEKEVKSEGLDLVKANCYACHNPNTASHDDIIAPPLVAVKNRYSKAYPSKDEFVREMTNWIVSPTDDMALMMGAVEQFNVMPKLGVSEEDARKIAAYIFDNEVEKPKWFAAHEKEIHGKGDGGSQGNGWKKTIALKDGQKWKSDKATMTHILKMQEIMKQNQTLDSEAKVKTLADQLSAELDVLFNDCTMEGPDHNALHKYLVPLIKKKDKMAKASDLTWSKEIAGKIQEQLNSYKEFFQE